MSRVVTPPTAQPATLNPVTIPYDKIAQRAYEKWVKHGQSHGRHLQDWLEAEAELRAEVTRSTHTTGTTSRR